MVVSGKNSLENLREQLFQKHYKFSEKREGLCLKIKPMRQIDNGQNVSARKRNSIVYGIGVVVLCLFFIFLAIWHYTGSSKQSTDIKVTDKGVYIPELEVQPDKAASMTAFFMYNGKSYCLCDDMLLEKTAIGSCLGTASVGIDEWKDASKYIDFSGTVSGKVYTVKGISKKFMLCLVADDGRKQIFINNKGIALNSGSEIFEKYLHVSEGVDCVTYETQESWDNAQGNRKELGSSKEEKSIFNQFIGALNDGKWMRMEDIPKSKDGRTDYDLQEYHVYLKLKTGVTLHLRLLEGGYVNLEGLNWVCVKINKEVYVSFINNFI